ncbi:hypothetical protein RI054_24g103220 [Pseudoscourfieldia marina]
MAPTDGRGSLSMDFSAMQHPAPSNVMIIIPTAPRAAHDRRATEDSDVNADVLRRLVAEFDNVDDAHGALDNRPRLGAHKKAVSNGRCYHLA